MPDVVIGGVAVVYIPDVDDHIDNGYTHVRIYWATSESASPTLVSTQALVAGTTSYEYNKTDALVTDWFEWALYGVTPGEGPRSVREPIGPPRYTRKNVRQEAGRRLRMVRVLTRTGTASTTSHTFADLIDADASSYLFCNQFLRTVSGATEETRRVRNKANSGFTPATGVLITNAFSASIAVDVECELWRPKGDEDPSELMDEAMQEAAAHLWWEETYYFTTESAVSEYYLPSNVRASAIRDVDYAAGTYPTVPRWTPVGSYDVIEDSRTPLMTLFAEHSTKEPYSSGKIVRVKYVVHADRMDNDDDSWDVPLEWAALETALRFLERLGTPSGHEEAVSDARRAKGEIEQELQAWRNRGPAVKVPVRLPR